MMQGFDLCIELSISVSFLTVTFFLFWSELLLLRRGHRRLLFL